MNWDAIGAIGEIVAAIAVVVTLGYLAIQIKQQNKAEQVNVRDSILEGFNRTVELMASDPSLAILFVRGLNDPDSLNDEEAIQFSALLRLSVNQNLKIYNLYMGGSLSRVEWLNYAAQGAWVMSRPGGVRWRESQSSTFNEFYDALLEVPFDDKAIDFTLGRPWKRYS